LITRIVQPSSVVLPESSELARMPPRPLHLRQPGYEDAFDSTSVSYDVFRCGNAVFLSGPPLLNLADVMRSATWSVDGRPCGEPELSDWDRSPRSWLHHRGGGLLTSRTPYFTGETEIGESYCDMFANRYCIVALSKNNRLEWIQEWLTFHHRQHGVTGAVIYDNASTDYGLDDLREAIEAVDGIEAAVVVSWPFKFGPEPGPGGWDSRYIQISALENARWRYLRTAGGVINADPDELVLTEDGRSVFAHAAASKSGVVRYHGRWIEMATTRRLSPDRGRRFIEYSHYDPTEEPTTAKWTLIPERVPNAAQWLLHTVAGSEPPQQTEAVMHRHFKGINTNWRRDYAEEVVDPYSLIEDEALRRALDAVFTRPSTFARLRRGIAAARSRSRALP